MSKIYLGASAFMDALRIESVRADRFYVQAMTFEGDEAGAQIIELLLASPAKDKRLLIDSFSKVVVSDHFVYSMKYLRDQRFRKEVSNTYTLIEKARGGGVKVQFTNPVGFLMSRYPLRNHKKMVILDDTAFLGGINFSDHNFAWHDMMVSFNYPFVIDSLAKDFNHTWLGRNQSAVVEEEDYQLFFLNGAKSKRHYKRLFDLLLSAKKEITLVSPYVSGPFLRALEQAHDKGINVRIFSTGSNNKSIFQKNLIEESKKGYFKLFIKPEMTHMKAILLDGDQLIVGSSNFDVVSYYFEQEILIVTSDRKLVDEFKVNVLRPLEIESVLLFEASHSRKGSAIVLKGLNLFCQVASKTFLKAK